MSESKIGRTANEKSEAEHAAVKESINELDKTPKRPREEDGDTQGEETSEKSESPKDIDEKEEGNEETKEQESSQKKMKNNNAKPTETGKVADDKSKEKFVFGASSAFGTGFGVVKKDTEDEKQTTSPESLSASDKTTKKPFAFGSGLSFGSGFNILKNKNDGNTEDEKKVNSGSESLAKASEEPKDTPKPLKLQKQEIKSGEESEECIYQVNAKLYQLSKIEEGWKERGVGVIKVNKSKEDTEKTRIVMRSRGILKVILNIQLVKGFAVQKGFTGSLQSEKFIRLLAVDDNGDPAQYAIKTGKKETTDELYNIIVKSVPK
ncbi:yrb2p [Saccharomyces arboricola H-6]|uniref:Yrb2p n=1 Tax=Saccharomyces arboricola (strain H-6 / AS 2.3317 / CBS 10644) TaxID=1160507 RepID=J8Q3S3_SACAR|nr:yrb2p [Saccharomyces arboricola H-6]